MCWRAHGSVQSFFYGSGMGFKVRVEFRRGFAIHGYRGPETLGVMKIGKTQGFIVPLEQIEYGVYGDTYGGLEFYFLAWPSPGSGVR